VVCPFLAFTVFNRYSTVNGKREKQWRCQTGKNVYFTENAQQSSLWRLRVDHRSVKIMNTEQNCSAMVHDDSEVITETPRCRIAASVFSNGEAETATDGLLVSHET
jgi:hypothetical protein